MQSFGATLSLVLIFVLNGIIQIILVVFSMKTSRDNTGMWSSENNDFKLLKTAKNIKITCTIVLGLEEMFYL